MKAPTVIHWFRRDLRLADNPAFTHACDAAEENDGMVLPIYIVDDTTNGDDKAGAASDWWLHHSLHELDKSLEGALQVFRGDPQAIFASLQESLNIQSLHWNRVYEAGQISKDKEIKSRLSDQGIQVRSSNGSLLWEPWDVLKQDGTPYKVFTPFYQRGCLAAQDPRLPLSAPTSVTYMQQSVSDIGIDELDLMPAIKWYEKLSPHWHIGEAGAQQRLKDFLDDGLEHYRDGRNFPAQQNVSRLSPHLHFGEISPNQAWYAARENSDSADSETFLKELGWREFSHSLLYHFPELPEANLQPKFDHFPWQENQQYLHAWQAGQTGYPIIDAGMRELWQTGYMHNRIRMVVGSFLVKNLLLDWRHGKRWFWDCLVDADLANNSASWQWVAGCGADAAPYFRVFNPILQGKKFDAVGTYTRQFVPELKDIPNKYLFAPWEAPAEVLAQANIKLGEDYPNPIVDLQSSRKQALAAYQQLKEIASQEAGS